MKLRIMSVVFCAVFGVALVVMNADAKSGNILLVDNFNQESLETLLGGKIAPWTSDKNDPSQWCQLSFDPYSYTGPTGFSLVVDYNIASTQTTYIQSSDATTAQEKGFHSEAFGGVFIGFEGADLTPYRYLVFSARGDKKKGFSRTVKIELVSQGKNGTVIYDKLDAHWRKHYIPLSKFSSQISLKSVDGMMIVFDENLTRKEGRILFDDIYFAKNKKDDLYLSEKFRMHVGYVADPIKIDGKLDDWQGKELVELNRKKHLELGRVSNNKDLSARLFMNWDRNYLYFAIHVRDNDIVCEHEGEDIFATDVVELYLDPLNNGFVWGDRSDVQLGISPCSPNGEPQIWAWFQKKKPEDHEVRYAVNIVEDGYVIESAVSWEFLSPSRFSMAKAAGTFWPVEGAPMGISIAVHDIDNNDKTEEAKLHWHYYEDESNKVNLGSMVLGRSIQ